MSKTIILIPSRLAAKRLPNKPLLKINGKSIISIVYKKAVKTKIGKVYVATGDEKIYQNINSIGGNCVLTKKKHKTGTDRIYEALNRLGISKYEYVLNLQGDEPMINISDIKRLYNYTKKYKLKMATLACYVKDQKKLKNKNIVKVKTSSKLSHSTSSRAINFERIIKNRNFKNIYHHIGIYIYKINILKKIVLLDQTKKEKKLKLEQLRALENKIPIHVVLAKNVPIGVDTPRDYKIIKNILAKKN